MILSHAPLLLGGAVDPADPDAGWGQVGNGLAITGINTTSLAALNSTDIAFADNALDQLRTYRWDETNWAQVGNSKAVNSGRITALTSTRVAQSDAGDDVLRTFNWSGSDWTQFGSSLSFGNLIIVSDMAKLNIDEIAFTSRIFPQDNGFLRTYRFDSSEGTWAQVGSSLAIVDPKAVRITPLSGSLIAFFVQDADELRTYSWDGSAWSQIGNSLNIGVSVSENVDIAALTNNVIAFAHQSSGELRRYIFDGTDWALLGSSLSIAGMGSPGLTALNSTTVAFTDGGNDELRTYQLT